MTKARDNANNWAGDISAVTAGTGITGGGTSGDVTVNLDSTAVISPTIFDAKADLLTATAADTPARLAVGTNGQVLTADSAEATGLKWTTISSGGLTQLASGSLSGNTVSLTSISGSYKQLRLAVFSASLASSNGHIQITFNADGGGTSNYLWSKIQSNEGTATWSGTAGYIVMTTNSDDYTTNDGNFNIDIFNYASTAGFKTYSASFIGRRAGVGLWGGGLFGAYASSSAITSIQISGEGTKTFDNGTYILYGVN